MDPTPAATVIWYESVSTSSSRWQPGIVATSVAGSFSASHTAVRSACKVAVPEIFTCTNLGGGGGSPGPLGKPPPGCRSGQVVHRVGHLDLTVGEAALEVAVLVADVHDDVVAQGLDVLSGQRLVLDRRAGGLARQVGRRVVPVAHEQVRVGHVGVAGGEQVALRV